MSGIITLTIKVPVSIRTAAAIQNPDATTRAKHEAAVEELSSAAALAAVETMERLPCSFALDDEAPVVKQEPSVETLPSSSSKCSTRTPGRPGHSCNRAAIERYGPSGQSPAPAEGAHRRTWTSLARGLDDVRSLGDFNIERRNNFLLSVNKPEAYTAVQSSSHFGINGGMRLHVKNLAGKIITLGATPGMTIEDVTEMLQDREGFPPKDHNLVFAGKVLDKFRTLSDYNIGDQSTLLLIHKSRAS